MKSNIKQRSVGRNVLKYIGRTVINQAPVYYVRKNLVVCLENKTTRLHSHMQTAAGY